MAGKMNLGPSLNLSLPKLGKIPKTPSPPSLPSMGKGLGKRKRLPTIKTAYNY